MASRRPRDFRVFRGAGRVAGEMGPNVVAFGKFDGLHLGHRALLDRAAGTSRRLGLPYGAVTFERHPYAHLRRGPVPATLTSLSERLRLFRAAGAQFVVLLPADATVLGLPAEQFVKDVLRVEMGVRIVVVGRNFRFGHRGAGGVLTLRELSSAAGLDGVEVGTVEVANGPVSATRIRARLAQGEVDLVRELLGRPYEVPGALRAVGPSTAAIAVPATRAMPAPGKYLGSLRRRPGTAVVAAGIEVGGPDARHHRLAVDCDLAKLDGDRPAGFAFVTFDKRV